MKCLLTAIVTAMVGASFAHIASRCGFGLLTPPGITRGSFGPGDVCRELGSAMAKELPLEGVTSYPHGAEHTFPAPVFPGVRANSMLLASATNKATACTKAAGRNEVNQGGLQCNIQ